MHNTYRVTSYNGKPQALETCFYLRGGTAAFFDNTITAESGSGYNGVVKLQFYRSVPGGYGVCKQDRFYPKDYLGTMQPGMGVIPEATGQDPHYPNEPWVSVPVYYWNNHVEASIWFSQILVDSPFMQQGRDYFVDIPKPGYTEFTYPHPLTTSRPPPATTPNSQQQLKKEEQKAKKEKRKRVKRNSADEMTERQANNGNPNQSTGISDLWSSWPLKESSNGMAGKRMDCNNDEIIKCVLIIKLGATGDVVRTTPLLRRLAGSVSWITAKNNLALLQGIDREVRCVSWEDRKRVADTTYDLVINLEDDWETSQFLDELTFKQLFGAHLNGDNQVAYTSDSRDWFDLSLISPYGREEADRRKLLNRRTYQELVFEGLGLGFRGEAYYLPPPLPTGLQGDVAISCTAGPVWPMKKWAYFDELKKELEMAGLKVNILESRPTLLEHLADVQGHRCVVSGDSLPMHLALGSGVPCVSIFTCTSPWEIYGYGLQKKIVSPVLEKFFYKRGYCRSATTAITLEEVIEAVMTQLGPLVVSFVNFVW